MKLRDYQERAIEITLAKLDEGVTKQVHVLATGLGKTVIFVHLISQLLKKNPGKKALILAHREELLTQAQEKILSVDPTLTVAIEMAEQKAEPNVDVVLASVATLGRKDSKRILKFDPKDFCVIVTDEGHHASASTYKNIYEYFGVLKQEMTEDIQNQKEKWTDWNTDILLLGVTATPNRNDNEGIDQIFDEVVYNYGIIDAIRDGWLSRIRAYRIDTTTDLQNVHTIAGDFQQDELADAVNNKDRNDLVVKTYKEQFAGKQALVFAVNIAHANSLTKAFDDNNISVASIDGTTPKDLRANLLDEFHQKHIQVIVNCMVLTEGYDNDTIDVVMMARPTKSGILYQQMIGRGTRLHKDKPYLAICDFVDNTYKHTLKTAASLLGIEGKVNFRGKDIVEAQDEIDKIRDLAPDFDLDHLDLDRLDYIMEEVDLMAGLTIPKDIDPITKYSWLRYGDNGYRISIGEKRYFVIEQTLTGQWEATFEYYDIDLKKTVSEYLGEEEVKDHIIQRVDNYIRNNYPEALILISMQADWRKKPMKDTQYAALRRLGVSEEVLQQLDRGKAAQLQTKLYAQRRYYK